MDIRVFAGLADLAQDEERPVFVNVDRHVRIANVLRTESGPYPRGEFGGGEAPCPDGAEQRYHDRAARIDCVESAQVLLSVDEDPQRIVGIKSVGSLDRPIVADLDDLLPRPLTLGTRRDRLPVVVLARHD